jgi:type VI secretion system secreted protein Hcp
MAELDYFMKVTSSAGGDIKGESAKKGHEDEIFLEQLSWEANQAVQAKQGGGLGAAGCTLKEFVAVKRVDSATAKIVDHCARGVPLTQVVVTCRKAGGSQQDYLRFTLEETLISNYKVFGPTKSEFSEEADWPVPLEEIKFTFRKIKWEYAPQKPDGSVGAWETIGYDRAAGTKQ